MSAAQAEGRWIAREAVERLTASRPEPGPALRVVSEFSAMLTEEDRRAVAFCEVDLAHWVAARNEEILASERARHAGFFDTVEARPLTDEQIRAVVTMDNRVHVVAAAGSGKTSVMVARAAYAIMRGFVRPDEVLLLAFNRDAATELRTRVAERLKALELPSDGLTAMTFHGFGLDVIGRATGRKPRVASWVASGDDLKVVSEIAEDLRDPQKSQDRRRGTLLRTCFKVTNPLLVEQQQSDGNVASRKGTTPWRDVSSTFAYRWDLLRLLYSRLSDTPAGGEHDGYDSDTRQTGFRTARGEVVKSEGERIIANWLHYNGVDYRYEKPYCVDVADPAHSQYQPDFYYPAADLWHEHWALDHNGDAPESFTGYVESMRWKKNLHRRHDTKLIETTWAQIIDVDGLTRLAEKLMAHGITLDWNPDRPTPGPPPIKHEVLVGLMRTFMTHVKSNALTRADVERRVTERASPATMSRTRLFCDLFWEIYDRWQQRLADADGVDFEDMLVEAAGHLEHGKVDLGRRLVMVDEFQDASQARARVTRALVATPGRYLLAVGDDWQSINRFAGADLSVMTRFAAWFGDGPTLRLQTSFRCPQSICDIAGGFVARNPRQINKSVTSAQNGPDRGVRLLHLDRSGSVSDAIALYLDDLAARIQNKQEPPGRKGPVSVFVLGRYRRDSRFVPRRRRWAGIDVKFRTVHGSKGLEADYVLVPNLTRDRYGFPSNIADDPVLNLVMADPDPYLYAEERRLFYVALTRARRGAVLVAVAGAESPFVVELLGNGALTVTSASDTPPAGASASDGPPRVCPICRKGTLVVRDGPYGRFYGCTSFPRCRHTRKLIPDGVGCATARSAAEAAF